MRKGKIVSNVTLTNFTFIKICMQIEKLQGVI